jgi:hypothetical protein
VPARKSVRKIKLCIPIYFDAGIYPSAGVYAERRSIYWRTIAVLCASIRRSSVSDLDIIVCTNEPPSSEISFKLNELDVSLISPGFSFRAPEGMAPLFSGAFYLFDCMTYCCQNFSRDDIFMFVDPDCLVMKGFDVIREYCDQWPLIGYELDIDKDQSVNGCSRSDLLAFLNTMEDNHHVQPPTYFGGEFFVAAGEALRDICSLVEGVWKINKVNFQSGRTSLKTEEHVLSAALALSPDRVGTGNVIIKRMWTRPSFRNVASADRALLIWHLPAEKRYGFQQLFYLIALDMKNLTSLNDRQFEDLVAQLVRLEPSSVEKVWHFLYPKVKSILLGHDTADG